ncbi:hypothetical protein L9F63_020946, partial [Diploptera punctata]
LITSPYFILSFFNLSKVSILLKYFLLDQVVLRPYPLLYRIMSLSIILFRSERELMRCARIPVQMTLFLSLVFRIWMVYGREELVKVERKSMTFCKIVGSCRILVRNESSLYLCTECPQEVSCRLRVVYISESVKFAAHGYRRRCTRRAGSGRRRRNLGLSVRKTRFHNLHN